MVFKKCCITTRTKGNDRGISPAGGCTSVIFIFRFLCRYHTVLVGADGVCIDGVAPGGVGQDAEGVAGVQDAAGLLGTPAHLVDVGLLNDLHIGDFIGKVAPVGFQMNDGTELRRAKVREVRARIPADKDCAVLAGQDAVTLGAAARAAAKLTLAVAPIEGGPRLCLRPRCGPAYRRTARCRARPAQR